MDIKTLYSSALPEKQNARPKRSPQEALLAQPDFQHYLDAFPDLTAVVNADRQVIYANRALLTFLHLKPENGTYGVRTGDLFHCLHVEEATDGCGSADHCQFCGAAQAIEAAVTTKQVIRKECILRARIDGQEQAYNFSVTASPFTLGDSDYILLNFKDIGAEKQKSALERIFFHDILNTISSLQVNIELMKRSPAEESREFLTKIEAISHMLIDEINSQKMLVSAENKTLKVQNNLILSTQLAQEVLEHFRDHEIAQKRELQVAPFSEAFAFVSDATILRRVLINMLKNALEATPPAATVTLGFKKEHHKVHYWVHNPTYIEKDIQLQVFNRYFSTKGVNRGLGTYSMKLLTEEYLQGRLNFETDTIKGTTFYMSIPLKEFSV